MWSAGSRAVGRLSGGHELVCEMANRCWKEAELPGNFIRTPSRL